ncbi:YadA-like family protein [Moraxella sp. K1664]
MTTVASAQNNTPSINDINKKLESLATLQRIVQGAIGVHTENIKKNQTSIAKNKTTLDEHTKQIDANKQAIEAKLGGKVDVQQLEDLKTSVDKNKADIADNKAAADAKFKDIKTDIAKNKTTLDEHTKQIDANKKDFEAKLGGKADEQKLAELKTSVDKNKAAADAKFAATEDALTRNAKNITKNTTSIRDLNTKVDGFDGRINALDSKVNTFDGRISALDAKVNGFDGRINALDDKFKNGMAAQAALNSLFQPYSVGKVSVSAAIGGYGSKSAIAIGTGYRVNPQLAFKGGTAINVSGSKKSSYNIGVNYEF